MTIINTTHHFIYVHIPKTAGTSVKRFLGQFTRYCDVEIGGAADAEALEVFYWNRFRLKKHALAREILHAVGRERFAGYFKFSFVRDPFARTLSIFRFLKFDFKTWGKAAVMDRFSNLEDFVTSDYFQEPGPDRILVPQSRWLHDEQKRNCMDFIGRVETLDQDVAGICRTLLLPRVPQSMSRRNVSSEGPESLMKELTLGKVVDAIRRRYEADFEAFGYTRSPGEKPPGEPVLAIKD